MKFWPFRRLHLPVRTPKPQVLNQDQLFHLYCSDISKMRKDRNSIYQAVILNKPGAKEELERVDTMIEIAEKTIIRLSQKHDREQIR
jgi:hypothetical protein